MATPPQLSEMSTSLHGGSCFVNERELQMAKNEDHPARIAILQEWDVWAQWHPREAKMAGGMLFFTYLQKKRSDLLLDFKAPGDKWQIVHSWLLRARKVKS